MLDSHFSQAFVTRLKRMSNVDVNIMNEKGIIIASADLDRVGDFHSCAYKMLKERLPIFTIHTPTDSMVGVKPGTNLLLFDRSEPIGVVGVTGPPDEVTQMAEIVKFSLESLLEMQTKNDSAFFTNVNDSKLARSLLFERPINPSQILRRAKTFKVENKCLRICLLASAYGEDTEQLTAFASLSLPEISMSDPRDLLFVPDSQRLVAMKYLPKIHMGNYGEYITDYADELEALLRKTGVSERDCSIRYYCSPPQATLFGCAVAYDQVVWLSHFLQSEDFRISFGKDYAVEYLVDSNHHAHAMASLFDGTMQLVQQHYGAEIFQQTVRALSLTDMKPGNAARLLFMHKNTVLSRVGKIKQLFGLNPLGSTKDAAFLLALNQYMSQAPKRMPHTEEP